MGKLQLQDLWRLQLLVVILVPVASFLNTRKAREALSKKSSIFLLETDKVPGTL
jgi:hypothetical protein